MKVIKVWYAFVLLIEKKKKEKFPSAYWRNHKGLVKIKLLYTFIFLFFGLKEHCKPETTFSKCCTNSTLPLIILLLNCSSTVVSTTKVFSLYVWKKRRHSVMEGLIKQLISPPGFHNTQWMSPLHSLRRFWAL